MSIGVGVPVYNDFTLINYLLDSIDIYTDRRLFKIAVLDDGSSDNNQKSIKKICENHNVDFIFHDKNLGVPKSWNDLVKHLNTDYVILLNNDILVFKNWFEPMKFFLENNPKIGTVSLPILIINREDINSIIENLRLDPKERPIEILEPCTRKRRNGVFNLSESLPPIRTTYPIGCIFGFSRKVYDMVNGFNEDYHSFYEEIEFGIKLYNNGYPSIILSGPHIYHVWGATFQINHQLNGGEIMSDSRKIFVSRHGSDYMEYFKTLDHNFNTTVSCLCNNTKMNVILNNTRFIDWCKEW